MSSISDIVKEGVKTGMLNARVAYPAIVNSFDPLLQTVTAYIAIKQIIGGQDVPLPLLVDVPIVLPSVQGFHMTMPINKGDEIVILFADRCFDSWAENGGVQKQSEHRVHHIADGMAIIGINSKPNLITDYDPDNMVIRNTLNTQKMTFKATGDIDVETDKNINVSCVNVALTATGNATVDVTGNATVGVTGDANLTAKKTNITSEVAITGTLAVSGAITSAVSIGAPSIIANSVEMADHVHAGVQAGQDSTQPAV